MKNFLPPNHSLPGIIVDNAIPRVDGHISITEAQFASLNAGVGQGESILLVSPTSTGKTLVGMWAVLNAFLAGRRSVYLVSHRAIASQKFEELRKYVTELGGDPASTIALAAGERISDIFGSPLRDPLRAPILVATYEKYLSVISSAGLPRDFAQSTIVADEVQLIGDKSRGQSVDFLLTILKNSRWKQFVGLSAVLGHSDAQALSDWLGVRLLYHPIREKHLTYIVTTATRAFIKRTDRTTTTIREPQPTDDQHTPLFETETLRKLIQYRRHYPADSPVVVFCMKKDRVTELAEQFHIVCTADESGQLPLEFDALPETRSKTQLHRYLKRRVAVHSADLTDDERQSVEKLLAEGQIDVVFATSTIAAGVNFPLAAALFDDFRRWNGMSRTYEPIDAAELHNMAGRVGRMGYSDMSGRVIIPVQIGVSEKDALEYLAFDAQTPLRSEDKWNVCTPEFILMLVSSGQCQSQNSALSIAADLFHFTSDNETIDREKTTPHKSAELDSRAALARLQSMSLLECHVGDRLSSTRLGRAVNRSGLYVDTSETLLSFVASRSAQLIGNLESEPEKMGGDAFVFPLIHACLTSPEFVVTPAGREPRRYVPWMLKDIRTAAPSAEISELIDEKWRHDVTSLVAAKLAVRWIGGEDLKVLEGIHSKLRAGTLQTLFNDIAWILGGLSGILLAASDPRLHPDMLPAVLRTWAATRDDLRVLARPVRTLARVVRTGIPPDLLWMDELEDPSAEFMLSRSRRLALRAEHLASPESLSSGDNGAEEARRRVFQSDNTPDQTSARLRNEARTLGKRRRESLRILHIQRASGYGLSGLFEELYDSRREAFERAFERLLSALKIDFEQLDHYGTAGAPDFAVRIDNEPLMIFELKTKENDRYVSLNDATDVLRASEIHGYGSAHCVTLCNPAVDPTAPVAVNKARRLALLNVEVFAEAALRLLEGDLSRQQFWYYLSEPGLSRIDELPGKRHYQ